MDYELMLIMKPLLPEDIKSKVITNIEKLVGDFGGKTLSSDIWGKRHLAYPINNHDEGYYIVYRISLPMNQTIEFDRQLNLMNGVLRFLRVKQSEV